MKRSVRDRIRASAMVVLSVVTANLVTVVVGPMRADALPPGFQESTVISGLDDPTAVRFSPDGRVFVAEKRGVIKVFDDLSDATPTTFADLNVNVYNFWDRGLLGMTLDPQFPTDPYVYVLYAYDHQLGSAAPAPRWGTPGVYSDDCPTPPGPTEDGCVASARLTRLTAAGNVMTGPEHVLVEDWCQHFQSHTIGGLAFGADGALYASGGESAHTGRVDYGQFGNPLNPCGDSPVEVGQAQTRPTAEGGALRSQDLRTPGDPVTLDGTLIRINPDTGDGLPTNPLASSTDANARRVVAYGLRNSFRITVRPGTSEVWLGDVGWGAHEEINRIPNVASARNLGWPCYEGPGRQTTWDGQNLNLCENLYAEANAVTGPYFSYAHDTPVIPGEACTNGSSSTSGLAFYNGGSYPDAYDDALFFADYSRSCIWVMFKGANGLPDPATIAPFVAPASNPIDLQIGPAGDLFYVDLSGGSIRRIQFSSGNSPPTAIANATPTSGAVPLEVSFDATESNDTDPGDTIAFDWDFDGDGTYGDSTSATPTFTYTQPGEFTARVRVSDNHGNTNLASVEINAGNTPPSASINAPLESPRWKVADEIAFSGAAVDDEDGDLDEAALTWSFVLHHCGATCHEHEVQDFVGVDEGVYIAPDHEYPSWLELRLTATDSGGLTATESVRLDPETVPVSFASEPAGLELAVGESSAATPFVREAIVGGALSVSALSPQSLAGESYEFVSWSDGGSASHDVSVGSTGATYTATFEVVDALVSEAEHYVGNIARSDHSWIDRADVAGFAGTGFVRNEPDNGALINADFTTTSPEVQYDFYFPAPGVYHVWLRGYATNLANDSMHVGLDGAAVATADRMTDDVAYLTWRWFNATMDGPVATVNVPTAGEHTVSVYMREDGFRLDRVLLTADPTYVPTGEGPPENPGEPPNPLPSLTNLSPGSVMAGSPGFTLTVDGTGFVEDAGVRWDGAARTTTFVSANRLTATISAADIAAAGSAAVTVVNPSPGGGPSNALTFAIEAAPPPVAAAGADETVAHNAAFTLDGSGSSNPGPAPVTYVWTQIGGPPAVIHDDESAQTIVDGVAGPATLTFRLTVTNGAGLQDTDDVVVTVKKAPK